ncbi:uncharacterized protein zgc:174935 [Chelmon rostratus]|uniref:uncharacterized protein zgc:174935 n=1 Tax=Chelmon rostratus TaxID=109905 RepID=UPI001BE825D1|nr:uncharacterized protein zgc:174935 [Chelmon rostratus]
MRAQCVLTVAVVVSVAMVGLMSVRKKEYESEDKRNRFEDIKLRVTNDVLGEYQDETAETQNLLDKTQREHQALEKQVNVIMTKEDSTKSDLQFCQGAQKSATDELAIVEAEYSNLKAGIDKENASWTAEIETLKKQLEARSPVCDFLKKNSQAISNLCGIEVNVDVPKQEDPKAEAPKQGDLSAEASKKEELGTEAPKQEEPKAEVPKTR